MGLIGTLISNIVDIILKYLLNKSDKAIKDKSRKYKYTWIPQVPIENNNTDIKNIDTYPKNYNLGFEDWGIDTKDSEDFIEGFDSFKIMLIKFLFTEKWRYKIYSDSYGVSYNLMAAKNQEEFEHMSPVIANEIMDHFKEYIIRIYSIKKLNNKSGIDIAMGLKGINEIVTINVLDRLQ